MSTLHETLLSLLQHSLSQLDIAVTEQQQQKLIDYVLMMDKWNKAYNLTSVRDPKDMVLKHLVDSVVIAPHITGQVYIDVGTGPGLPGIPLAILHPDKTFILLDSLGKRVRFMKQVAYELKIANIQAVQSRVEDYQTTLAIDGVLSRAFASLKDMLHWCEHLVDSSGTFLALKGQLPEEEIRQLPAGYNLVDVIKLQVPDLEGDRHLIKIQKNLA
ncbi:MAG: 16S rRNA (guanine527-N7)-methyltransferase [Paraglaciecola sp.]|jgi:16S rRNA (guanine527-N7)-methyltransferase